MEIIFGLVFIQVVFILFSIYTCTLYAVKIKISTPLSPKSRKEGAKENITLQDWNEIATLTDKHFQHTLLAYEKKHVCLPA